MWPLFGSSSRAAHQLDEFGRVIGSRGAGKIGNGFNEAGVGEGTVGFKRRPQDRGATIDTDVDALERSKTHQNLDSVDSR